MKLKLKVGIQTAYMPGSVYTGISSIPKSRVERPVRVRELRRINRGSSQPNEASDSYRETDENELLLRGGDNNGNIYW